MSSIPILRSQSDAARVENDPSTVGYGGIILCDYFGRNSGINIGPEAFLVDMPSLTPVRAHYHPVNQFQVMFGGPNATYKNRPLASIGVHYADAYTTYGPFASGDNRMEFFTLRDQPTTETGYMPEARDGIPATEVRRRHMLESLEPWEATSEPGPGRVTIDTVFDSGASGPRASLIRGGPGTEIVLPDSEPPGYYMVVIDGCLVDEAARSYEVKSLGWRGGSAVSAAVGELGSSRSLRAGTEGCHLLILQF